MLKRNQGLYQEIERKNILNHLEHISRTRMEERRSLVSKIENQKEDLLHKGGKICQKLNVIIVTNLITI